MTQEERQLLLIDLCARLPYGVIVEIQGHYDDGERFIRESEFDNTMLGYLYDDETIIKPYLRPLSSMTDEESEIATNISNKGKGFEEDEDGWIRCDSIHTKWGVWPDGCAKLLDYLNSIHIDYRCLTPIGLALEAPEGMYKTE